MASDSVSGISDNPLGEAQRELMRRVYALYAGFAATIPLDAKSGLGGRLFFGGDVQEAREMLFAANIAGAASLAASGNPAAVRQAMRDGVVDFVVTSLEEALRILKNEIRKRLPVSVGVSVSPDKLIEQMLERGVLPDILPARELLTEAGIDVDHAGVFIGQGAMALSGLKAADDRLVTWSVDREWMRWLPKLDACVKAVVPETDVVRQRWLQLAPRYLGRAMQKLRGVRLSSEEAERFRASAAEMMLREGADAKLHLQDWD
jgi:hypothetical protein